MNSSPWQAASFRGVPFMVSGFDRSGGRRGPNHEFPGKETGYPEDTGKTMEEFSVEAYVIRTVGAPDYDARRNALIVALNQPGAGELIHPAFGTVQVQLRSWAVNESKDALGVASFQLSFVECASPVYPSAVRSAAYGVNGTASQAHQAAAKGFAGAFAVAGKSDFLRSAAASDAAKIGAAYSRVCSSFGIPVDVTGPVAALQAVIDSTAGDALDVAGFVAALPQAVTRHFEAPFDRLRNADGTYRGVANYQGNGPVPATAITALSRVFDFTLDTAGLSAATATRRQQGENAAALAHLTRLSAVIEAARVAPFVDWTSIQEAEDARDRIVETLDQAAEETTDDDLFTALTDMRILVIRTVPPENEKLPALMDYVPLVTQPALVLSYRLYGTIDDAEWLAASNHLRHPGFVPAMETIRIISHAG
jgi:prophage DNA circulation protein